MQLPDLDERAQRLCAQGNYRDAATLMLSELGQDVIRVAHARLRDETATSEVFSQFATDLWTGLPSFAFRCSVRAWVFTIARNATHRYLERDIKRQRAAVPLSQAPELMASADSLRRSTLAHLRTENRDRVALLRSALSEEDQLILTLHVDRELSFREIAIVTLGSEDESEERVSREASRLRKRFQVAKDKIRRLLVAK